MTLYVRATQPISISVTGSGDNPPTFTLDQRLPYEVLPLWVAQTAKFQELWTSGKVQVATDIAFTNVVTSIPTSELGGTGGGGGGRETFADCAVWYVDGSTGNNSNDGLVATPKLTIAAAITAAGDTSPVLIRLANITSISLSGVKRNNRLHIMPTNLASSPTLTTVALDGCRAVDIRGFNVQQYIDLGLHTGGTTANACFDCLVVGNKVGPYTGVPSVQNGGVQITNQSQRCVVAYNEIGGLVPATGTVGTKGVNINATNGSAEIGVGNNNAHAENSSDLQIIGNYIHNNSADGIGAYGWLGGLQVIGNYITGMIQQPGSGDHVDGMQIAGGTNMLIKDNAVWDTIGGGGGIFVKDFYVSHGLKVENNCVYNMHDSTGIGFTGNGIALAAAPHAQLINNIVYGTSGMTELAGGFGKGGGLALWGSDATFGVGDPLTGDRVPDATTHHVTLIRNTFDCVHTPDVNASIAYRWSNWVYDPNGNGDHGYQAATDLKPGDAFGGMSTADVVNLCTYRTVTKLANEWRRDPFAYWNGAPKVTGGLSLDLGVDIGRAVTSITSSATPTPAFTAPKTQFNVTALATGATFGAPTGTFSDGWDLTIRVKDNGSAQTLAYNAIYRALGVTLPLTTVPGKLLYLGCKYNAADTKLDVVAVGQQA